MSAAALPVDGHVHLYPCFNAARWLAAAQANLAVASREAGLPAEAPGVLLLTETATEGAFARLTAGVPAPWEAERPEEEALVLRRPDAPPLVVVAGRQIQTAERIEVLAVASALPRRDGVPMAEVLDTLAAEGTPAILPWGVGKWTGGRGRAIAAALAARPRLLVGDNAGRPTVWRAPPAFAGHIVLPGTDPLPCAGAESVIGRYGFVLEGGLDPARPAADLRDRLAGLARQPRTFGGRVGPVRAAIDQLRLRLPA